MQSHCPYSCSVGQEREFKERSRSKEHGFRFQQACTAFHTQYDSLAFPGGLSHGLNALAQVDPNPVDLAISFLEAAQLSQRLTWPELEQSIGELTLCNDAGIRRGARWVQEALRQKPSDRNRR